MLETWSPRNDERAGDAGADPGERRACRSRGVRRRSFVGVGVEKDSRVSTFDLADSGARELLDGLRTEADRRRAARVSETRERELALGGWSDERGRVESGNSALRWVAGTIDRTGGLGAGITGCSSRDSSSVAEFEIVDSAGGALADRDSQQLPLRADRDAAAMFRRVAGARGRRHMVIPRSE